MIRCVALVVAVVLGLAGPSLAQSAFPVTIKHAFGETVLRQKPVRIVTWGWSNEDALLSFGVVPVAMPFQAYGGGENGIQPWVEDALKALGAPDPAILDSAGEPPIEQIAALQPDLIVAVFSGITAEQYATLSAIAPTLAYSGEPWSAPWQDVVKTVGAALGEPAKADSIIAETLDFVAQSAAHYPELKGASFAAVNDYDGSLAVYDAPDARVAFLQDLGLVLAPSVEALSPKAGAFYFPVSYELADTIKSDIIVTYGEDQAIVDAFLAKPFMPGLPQFKNDAIAALVGTQKVAAVSPPCALSLRWGLNDYLAVLARAARNSKR